MSRVREKSTKMICGAERVGYKMEALRVNSKHDAINHSNFAKLRTNFA